jgi:HAMP domain-containing protein
MALALFWFSLYNFIPFSLLESISVRKSAKDAFDALNSEQPVAGCLTEKEVELLKKAFFECLLAHKRVLMEIDSDLFFSLFLCSGAFEHFCEKSGFDIKFTSLLKCRIVEYHSKLKLS